MHSFRLQVVYMLHLLRMLCLSVYMFLQARARVCVFVCRFVFGAECVVCVYVFLQVVVCSKGDVVAYTCLLPRCKLNDPCFMYVLLFLKYFGSLCCNCYGFCCCCCC